MTYSGQRTAILLPSLQAAVPLWIAQLAALDEPARAFTIDRWWAAAWEPLAHMSDVGMMGGGRRGEAAGWFNHLARAIAAMSFAVGGVTCFGLHWCQDHAACCEELVQHRIDVYDCEGDLPAAFARAQQREVSTHS